MKIDIYCVGYKQKSAVWAASLVMTTDDGQQMSETRSGVLGDLAKNIADVVSVINALQCVKPDFRQSKVTLYAPAGYAYSMLEQTAEKQWLSTAKTNAQYINAARDMYSTYGDITLAKLDSGSEQFRQLMDITKPLGKEEYANRVERTETDGAPAGDGETDKPGASGSPEV